MTPVKIYGEPFAHKGPVVRAISPPPPFHELSFLQYKSSLFDNVHLI